MTKIVESTTPPQAGDQRTRRTKQQSRMIPLNQVAIDRKRWHVATDEEVAELARSMAGPSEQINPIQVSRYCADGYKVIAGATRVKAARKLGWDTIEAIILNPPTRHDPEIIEIEENLASHRPTKDEARAMRERLKDLQALRLQAYLKRHDDPNADIADIADTETAKPKGGRGKKGGLRQAARELGIPETTARELTTKVRGKDKIRAVSKPETKPVAADHEPKTEPSTRSPAKKEPLAERGKNPEHHARVAERATLYQPLRDSLVSLAKMPLAGDVAAMMAGTRTQTETINRRLPAALAWLGEFDSAWALRLGTAPSGDVKGSGQCTELFDVWHTSTPEKRRQFLDLIGAVLIIEQPESKGAGPKVVVDNTSKGGAA
jgi:ParB-like chromosome segregation protein Spo0J